MNNKILLISVNKIKKDSYLDENVSDDKIRIAIEFIQDSIIENVIGTSLYNTLIEFIENLNNQTELEGCDCALLDLLDNYIAPIFLYGVQAELNIPLSFKERNIGNFQIQDERISGTQLNDIKYLNQYYINKQEFYINRCIEFLKCNIECFPEIRDCGCSWCKSAFNSHTSNLGIVFYKPNFTRKRWRR